MSLSQFSNNFLCHQSFLKSQVTSGHQLLPRIANHFLMSSVTFPGQQSFPPFISFFSSLPIIPFSYKLLPLDHKLLSQAISHLQFIKFFSKAPVNSPPHQFLSRWHDFLHHQLHFHLTSWFSLISCYFPTSSFTSRILSYFPWYSFSVVTHYYSFWQPTRHICCK